MISLDLRRFSYQPDSPPVLADITFDVAPGRSLVLAGGSGSGKSTVARILAGQLPRPGHGSLAATIGLAGQLISFHGSEDDPQLDFAAWSSLVGYVSQNPRTQLSTVQPTVAGELGFGLENQGLEPEAIRQRVAAMADLLDLGPVLQRSPLEISGGQLQKLAIGSMVVTGPRVLVLDEPEAGLDLAARTSLYGLLHRLLDTGVALVVCTPSLGGFTEQADEVMVLDGGRCRLRGPWHDVVRSPEAPRLPVIGNAYVELSRAAATAGEAVTARGSHPLPVSEPEAVDYFAPVDFGPGPETPVLETDRTDRTDSPDSMDGSGRTAASGPEAVRPAPLAALEQVTFRYGTPPSRRRSILRRSKTADAPEPPALADVTLRIHPGERIAVMGPNGAGKSTLLRHLNGLARPASGRVLVGGRNIAFCQVGRMAQEIGFLFQDSDLQLFERTVEREVSFGLRRSGLSREAAGARVAEALRRTGLDTAGDVHPYELSAAARKRVALASILAMGPGLWVLDEPTTSQDRPGLETLAALIAGHAADGGAVVMATHDADFAAAVCDRLVVLDAGRIVADGPFSPMLDELAVRPVEGVPEPRIRSLAARLGLAVEDLSPQGFVRALGNYASSGWNSLPFTRPEAPHRSR